MTSWSVGDAVMRYGASMAINDSGLTANVGGHVVTATWANAGMTDIVYGAPIPATTSNPSQATTSPADRDEWWKWAAGAGLVSMAAYIVYLKVTGKK